MNIYFQFSNAGSLKAGIFVSQNDQFYPKSVIFAIGI